MIDFLKDRLPEHPRLIFMGTPDFALPTLAALIEKGHDVAAVVTQPDRPKGRGKILTPPPVKRFALQQGIEVLQPERASNEPFCTLIREKAPDVIVVVAFGQILKKNLLDIPGWGVINVHGSLLPAYRGAAPIQRAVLNNEAFTGLTVMHMDEGMDTGPILFQKEVPIGPNETAGQLHDRLAILSGELLVESLGHMAEHPIVETPQEDSRATYAPKIEKQDCLLDWTRPAEEISARIRGLDPRPGAYTSFNGTDIKLFSSRVFRGAISDPVPGRVKRTSMDDIIVETGEGAVEIGEIQYPGKKRLSVADFLRGFSLPEGALLGR